MIRRCFLACWVLTFSTVALQSTQYALPGQMVAFEPVVKTRPDEILWKHNGNKVVEFNGNEETVYSPFEKRITLNWHTAVLKIKQLSHGDSGEYELDVLTEKRLDRFNFALKVIDSVTKPIISCKMNNGSSDKSGNEATLMCSANSSQSQSLMFEWSQHGTTYPGPILKILLGKEYDDEVYTCTVSNDLSKEMSTFTAKDCYRVNRSAGLSAGLTAAIGLIVALCVLGALGIAYCKLKHKACFAKEKTKDVEHQPALNEADDYTSKPLLDRLPTIPSNQRLRPLPRMSGNKNYNRNDEETESDEDTGTGLVKRRTKQFEQKQEPTGLETNENKLKRIQLPVAEKPFNGNLARNVKGEADADPHREEPEKKVLAIDHLEDHSGATQRDQQPFTSAELPESETEEDKKAPNMAPSDEHKEEKQDAITDQITRETEEENEKKKEENESDVLRGKEKSPATDEQTESEKEEDKKAPNMAPADELKEEKQDAIAGQVTGENKEENEKKKEEKESDVLREKEKLPTTDEQTGLESNTDKSKKTKPPVPKKSPYIKIIKGQADVNGLRENKVSEPDGLKEPSGATESDLQSSTASETPGLESNTDKSKKTKPPVPKKSPSIKIIKGQADVNGLRENKVSDRDGLKEPSGAIESDLQSSTASETPELEKEADNKAKSAPEVSGSPSAAEPCSPLTQTSPEMAPKNDAGERVDDSNSEQVNGESNEENVGK